MIAKRFFFCLTALVYVSTVAHGQTSSQAPQALTTSQRPAGTGGGFTHPATSDWSDHTGWTALFDGKTLAGWDYSSDYWTVENGAIVGTATAAKPVGTTNIIWRGGEPANFRIRFEWKLEGTAANGGFQYRGQNKPLIQRPTDPARLTAMTPEMRTRMEAGAALRKKYDKWDIWGYQADFDAANRFTGQLYDAGSTRGIVAWRGDVVEASDGKVMKLASLGTEDETRSWIKPLGEWNQMEIIADGNVITHILNGHVTALVVDTDAKNFAAKGVIAFELEGTGDVKISHRNIWMKTLP